MYKNKLFSKCFSLLLAVVFLVSFAACGNSGNSTSTGTGEAAGSSAAQQETTQAAKEIVTITWGDSKAALISRDNPVLKEIEKRTSVKLEVIDLSGEKQKVMFSSGETHDINSIETTILKTVIDNKLALPLDNLLQTNGQDLLKYHSKALNLFKKFISNGESYFTPVYAGDPTQEAVTSYKPGPTGFYVRWDYFKEAGAPELKTLDDLVNALAAMQKAHPKTTAGKKIYGISGWQEWGPTWNFSIQFGFPNGMVNIDNTHEHTADNKLSNTLTDPESVMWQAAEFYYKCNKAGILDPDFFINKYDDYIAKYSAGQLLTVAAGWQTTVAKSSIVEEFPLSTFVGLPIVQDFPYNTAISSTSWTTSGSGAFYNFIGKDCKNPERVMEFLSWMSTPEASRIVNSGVQGIHWDMVDGKPSTKAEVREAVKQDPDYLSKNGIGIYQLLAAYDGLYICPDGYASNLISNDQTQFALQNTEGDKDFCTYYGISYPGELFKKLQGEGKLKEPERINEISSLLPTAPNDIKQIDASCENYFKENVPKAVLAKDDEAFKAAKEAIIAGVKKLGADKSDEWWNSTFETTKADVLEALK